MASAFEKAIAVLAGAQYGYVTRVQLLRLGMGARAIDYRIATGRLIPAYKGVYAVGHLPVTPVARAFAAVLACGDDAVLSHGSAATLWGFNKHWEKPYEVTTPSLRTRDGIKVHRSRTLTRHDTTTQLGVRVTSPARTVLDIAPGLSDRRLTRVVNDARHAAHLHLSHLADVLNRNPNHPATKRLVPFVHTNRNPTRSPLEDDFLAFAKRYGLPTPTTNTYLLGYEIDVLYPRERVIVEIDGYPFHSDRDSFERDRERDAVTLEAGFVTVRITRRRLKQQPVREAQRLNAILLARRRLLA